MSRQCTGCGLYRLDAINAVLNGKVACCPDCSTLTVEERNLLRNATFQGEALRRLRKWGGLLGKGCYSADVALSIVDWIDAGMNGPLPPLPNRLLRKDMAAATTNERVIPEEIHEHFAELERRERNFRDFRSLRKSLDSERSDDS